jgi:hypothetical protein
MSPNRRLPVLVLGAFGVGYLVNYMLDLPPLSKAALVSVASASTFVILGWLTGKRAAA